MLLFLSTLNDLIEKFEVHGPAFDLHDTNVMATKLSIPATLAEREAQPLQLEDVSESLTKVELILDEYLLCALKW